MPNPPSRHSRRALIAVLPILTIATVSSAWVALQHYRQYVFVQAVESTGGRCTASAAFTACQNSNLETMARRQADGLKRHAANVFGKRLRKS